MRLLHTSDWHLGHSLHQIGREVEHAHFIDWLLALAVDKAVDAVLITGDVFDNSNPPASAQQMWFDFLHRLIDAIPGVDVVVIAGNHDSPGRIEAPARLLAPMGVRVVGRVSYVGEKLDVESLVVPLHAGGRVRAQVAAVPFLRPSDLLPYDGPLDPLVEGVRRIYDEVCEHIRQQLEEEQSLVVAGHLYAVGCDVSQLSERRILGGHQHALPGDIFPADAAYVALGHLHKAQRLGGRDNVRYAGSPIPLSLGEARYRHQVCIADLDGSEARVETHAVPRTVDIVRVPARGAVAVDEIKRLLEDLPLADGKPAELRPFLEVVVRLDEPQPNLRHEIESSLEGRWPRLAKLGVEYTGTGVALPDGVKTELRDLEPEEVFVRRYRRDHEGDVPAELLDAFREIAANAAEEVQ